MKVEYLPELKERPDLLRLAEATTPIVKNTLAAGDSDVVATWSYLSDGRGRPLLRLTLAGWREEASMAFAPEDLRPEDEVRYRVRRLWLDVLSKASDRQLERLKASVAEE